MKTNLSSLVALTLRKWVIQIAAKYLGTYTNSTSLLFFQHTSSGLLQAHNMKNCDSQNPWLLTFHLFLNYFPLNHWATIVFHLPRKNYILLAKVAFFGCFLVTNKEVCVHAFIHTLPQCLFSAKSQYHSYWSETLKCKIKSWALSPFLIKNKQTNEQLFIFYLPLIAPN